MTFCHQLNDDLFHIKKKDKRKIEMKSLWHRVWLMNEGLLLTKERRRRLSNHNPSLFIMCGIEASHLLRSRKKKRSRNLSARFIFDKNEKLNFNEQKSFFLLLFFFEVSA